MYTHISAWESSGQPQREYMAEQGLSKSVFGYWLRKYRQEQQINGGGFVAVRAVDSVGEGGAGFARLRLQGGEELILNEAVSAAYLRELLGW